MTDMDGADFEAEQALDLGGFEADGPEEEAPHIPDDDGEPEEIALVGFADELGEDGDVEEAPLVKRLRDQLREAQRGLKAARSAPVVQDDPEPVIPRRQTFEELDYDQDKFDALDAAREKAIRDHAAWTARQGQREADQKRAEQEQVKQLEQQRKSLGVSDYDDRMAVVRDTLSEAQLAVLMNGADNPAKLIYALGRSPARLDELAGITNLAKFAAKAGRMEDQIKVAKRKAPAPESQVRGAVGGISVNGGAKQLARLEAEAEKTGDRSKVIAYRREMRKAQAA